MNSMPPIGSVLASKVIGGLRQLVGRLSRYGKELPSVDMQPAIVVATTEL